VDERTRTQFSDEPACSEQRAAAPVFRPGDYVGYRRSDDTDPSGETAVPVLIYGRVREQLQSPSDDVDMYLLDLGSGHDGCIATARQMTAFARRK